MNLIKTVLNVLKNRLWALMMPTSHFPYKGELIKDRLNTVLKSSLDGSLPSQ